MVECNSGVAQRAGNTSVLQYFGMYVRLNTSVSIPQYFSISVSIPQYSGISVVPSIAVLQYCSIAVLQYFLTLSIYFLFFVFVFCFLFFEISHLFPLPLPVSNRPTPFEVWHSHCHPLKLLIPHLHPPPLFNSSVKFGNPISHMGIRRWVRPGLARSILCGGFLLSPWDYLHYPRPSS